MKVVKGGSSTRWVVLAMGFAAVGWLVAAGTADATLRVPIKIESCDLQAFGSNSPTGMTFNSDTGFFVVLDDNDDVAYSIDASCVAAATFSTGAFGANNPQGISYDAGAEIYAIVDPTDLEVYFANFLGLFQGNCDLAASPILSTSPRGVAFNPTDGTFAIVDNGTDQVYVIDASEQGGGLCNLVAQFSTASYSLAPESIAYVPGDDDYAIVDADDEEVYIVDADFVLLDQYDTLAGFGSGASKGMFYLPTDGRSYFVDSTTDSLVTVDANGILEPLCSTADVLSNNPAAVTFNPDDQEIVFADDVLDQVFIVDSTDCGLVRQFDVAGLGIEDVSGVSYRSSTNQLIVTDQTNDGVYFVGYDSGLLEASCDTTGIGLTGIRGVSLMEDLDRIVIADLKAEAIGQLDLDCNPVAQRSAAFLGSELGASEAGGVTFQPALGRFLIADSATDEVFVTSYEGFTEWQFDLQGLGLTSVTGISSLAGGDRYLLVDSDQDMVSRATIPLLTTPLALSGRFTTGGGIPILLYEREDGTFTGEVKLPSGDLPAFGVFDAAGLTLTMVVETATGPRTFTGNVAPDLNGISLPAPVGNLTRSF